MTEPADPYEIPIVPGPSYEPPTAPVPPPQTYQPPPQPQVVYVQVPTQGSSQVTRGIWDFLLQAWVIVAVIFFVVVLCCVGFIFIGALGRQ